MKGKNLAFVIVVLLTLACMVPLDWIKKLRESLVVGEGRQTQIFPFIFGTIAFLENFVSFITSIPQLVLRLISTLVLLLSSSVTRTAVTTTTTMITTLPTTTIITSSLPAVSTTTGTLLSSSPATTGTTTTTTVPDITTSTEEGTTSTEEGTTTTESTMTTTQSTTTTTGSPATTTTTEPRPKIVFVTSSTFDGNFGGIDGADQECQTLATTGTFSGTFFAWISNSSVAPIDRFVQNTVPYSLPNGTRVADSFLSLVQNQMLLFPIALDENGNEVDEAAVWTGTAVDGNGKAPSGNFCTDWTTAGASTAVFGLTGRTGLSWTEDDGDECFRRLRLYCFEQ